MAESFEHCDSPKKNLFITDSDLLKLLFNESSLLKITLAPHFPEETLAVVDPIKSATGSIEQPPPHISWNRRWSYTLRAPMAFPVESKTGSHRNFDFNWLPVSQSKHVL